MSDIGKRGWSNLSGSNISSPQGGYSDFSEDSGYQRSQSGDHNEWNTSWSDSQQNKSQMTSSQSAFGDSSWSGFDTNGGGGYQQTSSSTQQKTTRSSTSTTKKSMKLAGDNFESLDVKSTKPAASSAALPKNKAEEDAWNLLND